jgi:hypothetical protein
MSEYLGRSELLWVAVKSNRRIACRLRDHGRLGFEYRLFEAEHFHSGLGGFDSRESAVQAASKILQTFELHGWTSLGAHYFTSKAS